MFEQSLFGNTKEILALLGKSGLLNKAYLAGGTGAALQLGHRISIDLDFFTPEEFNADELARQLKHIGDFKLQQIKWGTLLGEFKPISFSIFVYKYPVLFPFKSFYGIDILDIREIGVMKLEAIGTRGKKRDFVDLYFICKEVIGIQELLPLYIRKYGELGSKIIHIIKSLTYFEDAEVEEMPKMLIPVNWEQVKNFFEKEVGKIGRELLTGGKDDA